MNAWFDRVKAAASEELAPEAAAALTLSSDEARALLDMAREAAHVSGARHFAPLLAYLAGRLAQVRAPGDEAGRVDVVALLARAAQQAGPAGEDEK